MPVVEKPETTFDNGNKGVIFMYADQTVRQWLSKVEPEMISAARDSPVAAKDLAFFRNVAHIKLKWISPKQMIWLVNIRDRCAVWVKEQELKRKAGEVREVDRPLSPVYFASKGVKKKTSSYTGLYPRLVNESVIGK